MLWPSGWQRIRLFHFTAYHHAMVYLVAGDDGSLPVGRFIGFYATWGWDEWGGFPLPSSQTNTGEQLFQGRYAVAWGRFEPATFGLQGTELTPTLPRLIAGWVCNPSIQLMVTSSFSCNSQSPPWFRQDFDVGKSYQKKVILTNVSHTLNVCKLSGLSEHLKDFIELT